MTEHDEDRFRFALRELHAYLERKPEDCTAAAYRRARAALATINRRTRSASDTPQLRHTPAPSRKVR
jgi:DNA polymerase/3'-5' exonuclease PolX